MKKHINIESELFPNSNTKDYDYITLSRENLFNLIEFIDEYEETNQK